MKMIGHLREKWNAYLKRLAEANKKTFGSGPLECCELNKYEKNGTKNIRKTR